MENNYALYIEFTFETGTAVLAQMQVTEIVDAINTSGLADDVEVASFEQEASANVGVLSLICTVSADEHEEANAIGNAIIEEVTNAEIPVLSATVNDVDRLG